MSFLIDKCKTGFLLLPSVDAPLSEAYHLSAEEVPEPVKKAFEDQEKEKALRAQLKSIVSDLSLPTLDQEVADRIAA